MKALTLVVCLAAYAQPSHSDAWYRDVCGSSTEQIADDDPGLRHFRHLRPDNARHALAEERADCAQSPRAAAWYRDICNGGPTEDIPDDDPGLKWFPDMPLEDAKVALAIERVNSCYEGETK